MSDSDDVQLLEEGGVQAKSHQLHDGLSVPRRRLWFERYRSRILWAVAGGLVAVALLLALYMRNQSDPNALPTVSLDAVLNGTFRSDIPSMQWTENGLVFGSKNGSVFLRKGGADTGSISILADSHIFPSLKDSSFVASSDSSLLLLYNSTKKLWRWSFTAKYWLLPARAVDSSQLRAVAAGKSVRCASLSPPGGKWVAYVVDNNVFVENVGGAVIQVTSSGSAGKAPGGVDGTVFNGVPDWIYEEEVLGSGCALWWSPDGSKLSFIEFNDSAVNSAYIPTFGSSPHSEYTAFRYPTAGTPNPTVKLFVYDVAAGMARHIPFPLSVPPDHIIGAVQWVPSSPTHMMTRVLNRIQNTEWTFMYSALTDNLVLLRKVVSSSWISLEPQLLPISSTSFAAVADVNDYATAQVWTAHDNASRAIPSKDLSSNVIVTDLLCFSGDTLFFRHTDGSENRSVSMISLKDSTSGVVRINNQTGWIYASFSPDCSSAVVTYAGPAVPYVEMVSVVGPMSALPSISERSILHDNAELREVVSGYNLPRQLFFQLPGADGTMLNAALSIPPSLPANSGLPVLVKVYGGPGSQAVTTRFGVSFDTWITSLGAAVLKVDGRGTAGRTVSFERSIFRRLGVDEPADQVSAARALVDSPALKGAHVGVDSSKLAVWGWSYGGTVAGLCGTDPDTPFAAALSVAPVANWSLYDSIYTERYMGLPSDNVDGYAVTLTKSVLNLKIPYLLVHGTADDNVHFLNSARVVDALVDAGIETYDTRYYPNKDHSLAGYDTRKDLYKRIARFLRDSHVLPEEI